MPRDVEKAFLFDKLFTRIVTTSIYDKDVDTPEHRTKTNEREERVLSWKEEAISEWRNQYRALRAHFAQDQSIAGTIEAENMGRGIRKACPHNMKVSISYETYKGKTLIANCFY